MEPTQTTHPQFEHRRTLDSRHARFFLGPLLETHELALPQLAAGSLEFRFDINLLDGPLDVWAKLPRRAAPEHFDQMKRVVWAVQRALRIWEPYLYFQNAENYADKSTSWPMLVYAAMRPIESRSPTCYGYDVLEPKRITSSFSWASKPLRVELHRLHDQLPTIGRAGLLAAFPSRNPERMLGIMEAIPRYFGRLVRMEAAVLREFSRLADTAPNDRLRRYPEIESDIGWLMQRTFRGFSFSSLTPLVMMSANWALARAQGLDPQLEARVSFQVEGNGHGIRKSTEISYANSRLQRPLR
ncbi:MAG: hypothetical protein U0Q16_22625 [Bryobacteraceae bacterium]